MLLADTTTQKAVLAALSAVDIAWTQEWLHDGNKNHFEADPLLGKHPTLTRMVVEGIAANIIVSRLPGRYANIVISIEGVNVARNFAIGVGVKL